MACTGHDHVERTLDADRAWQPLRAARAGQQPELHLRQRDLRIASCDAKVASERELESAAHADASDGGNDRLRACLYNADRRVERPLGFRLRRIALPDVRAARGSPISRAQLPQVQ